MSSLVKITLLMSLLAPQVTSTRNLKHEFRKLRLEMDLINLVSEMFEKDIADIRNTINSTCPSACQTSDQSLTIVDPESAAKPPSANEMSDNKDLNDKFDRDSLENVDSIRMEALLNGVLDLKLIMNANTKKTFDKIANLETKYATLSEKVHEFASTQTGFREKLDSLQKELNAFTQTMKTFNEKQNLSEKRLIEFEENVKENQSRVYKWMDEKLQNVSEQIVSVREKFKDCMDVREEKVYTGLSGVYNVLLPSSQHVVQVYCDMDSDGGGWTVFQRRFDGSENFYRKLNDYENGFGQLNEEFWLGLRVVSELTRNTDNELRIEMESATGERQHAIFDNFSIGPGDRYKLTIGVDKGPLGNTNGMNYNNGYNFSTIDRDLSGNNCAERDRGGWWYGNCAYANLNGDYITPGTKHASNSGETGFTYRKFKQYEALKASKMMFRRKV